MKKTTLVLVAIITYFGMCFYNNPLFAQQEQTNKQAAIQMETQDENDMKLGAFSMSLNVKDLKASKEFYETLGFTAFAGSMEHNYLIMKNGNALIGLFQGMFEGNILTFNPGWDENAKNVENFNDVREIQQHLKNNNIALTSETDEKSTGPASISLTDPDGNVILIDQHR